MLTEEERKSSEVIARLDGSVCRYQTLGCTTLPSIVVWSAVDEQYYKICSNCFQVANSWWRHGAIFYVLSNNREIYRR